MRTIPSKRALLGSALALAMFAAPDRASASAFQLLEQNASGLGQAYSGQAAAAEDASTIYFNPAGLSRLTGRQVVLSVDLVRPTVDFENNGSTVPAAQTSLGGDGGDAGGIGAVPSGYLSWEVAPDRLWAGLGVNAPFGLATEWDGGWAGRFHALDSDVKTINVNPAVAVKLHELVSVGAGVNWQWITAKLSNSVNYSAAFLGSPQFAALPPAQRAAAAGQFAAACPGATTSGPATGTGCEGAATIKGDDRSWGWNVGVLFDLPTQTRVGLSYRSSIEHELEGNVKFGNRPAQLAAGLPDGDIEATIELPDTASVAVAQGLLQDRLELLADFTWTGWSKLKDLSIFRASGAGLTSTPLEFDDSWRVGLGANYQLVPEAWKIRGGVAYDTTPVQDADRTPRLPDQDRFWIATGAQWAFSKAGAIDVGVAWLFVKNASSNLPSVDPAPPAGFTPPPRGDLKGEYDASVWIAAAQARYAF